MSTSRWVGSKTAAGMHRGILYSHKYKENKSIEPRLKEIRSSTFSLMHIWASDLCVCVYGDVSVSGDKKWPTRRGKGRVTKNNRTDGPVRGGGQWCRCCQVSWGRGREVGMGEPTKLAWKNERYFHRVEFLPGVCVWVRVRPCTTAWVWRSEVSLWEPALSFSCEGDALTWWATSPALFLAFVFQGCIPFLW